MIISPGGSIKEYVWKERSRAEIPIYTKTVSNLGSGTRTFFM